MTGRLFREEVVEAKRRRLWGEVMLSQPPSLMIWTALLTVVCLAVFAALFFASFTRKETVPGYLAPEGGLVQISAAHGGRIVALHVHEGQAVRAGDPLFELTSETATTAGGEVLAAQLAETDAQLSAIGERQSLSQAERLSEARRLQAQVRTSQEALVLLGQRREQQTAAVELAEREVGRFEVLLGNGYVTRTQLDQRRRSLLAEQAALTDLDRERRRLEGEVADLEARRSTVALQFADTSASLSSERAQLRQRRIDLDAARRWVERAPVDGVVTAMEARVGQTPPSGLPLAALSPRGAALEADLLIPTRSVGFLKAGQEVNLEVSAYPFQRFGFIRGDVVEIARSPLRPGEFASPVEVKEPVYRVRVRLRKDYITAYGERRVLKPGMILKADIVLDRRRLWQVLMDPILAVRRAA